MKSSSSDEKMQQLLPWNDINILVDTDAHSWIGGHGEHYPEERWNVDYGDILSFYQQLVVLKEQKQKQSLLRRHDHNSSYDLFGTGLSTIPPRYLTPLLQEMPWDAINVGNHELYFDDTVQHLMQSGFIQHWNRTYLSSNTVLSATQQPLGNRFTFLRGRQGNNTTVTLLTFGFLYNFQDHCASTNVERVEQVVQQQWFRHVLRHPPEPYHAILVLAHMDCVHPLVFVILHAIRTYVRSDLPVLFITGHSHRRAFARLDNHAVSFEAGRYLDTLGWISFSPSPAQLQQQGQSQSHFANTTTKFEYRFLDASLQTFRDAIGIDGDFSTPAGRALTRKIHDAQEELGLHHIVGCSSHTYLLEEGFESSDQHHHRLSLWGLYTNEVIPKQLLQKVDEHYFRNNPTRNLSHVFVQGTGALRYSLLSGKVTRDDVIAVCPFNDSLYIFDYPLRGYELLRVLHRLEETYGDFAKYSMPAFVTVPSVIHTNETYRLIVPDFEYKRISPFIVNVTNKTGQPTSTTPRPVCIQNECLHTLDLWMQYVREEMPCLLQDYQGESSIGNGSSGPTFLMASTSLLEPAMIAISAENETFMATGSVVVIVLMAFVAVRMLTSFLRQRQYHQRSNDVWKGALHEEYSQKLFEANGTDLCSYGSIHDNSINVVSPFSFSQANFNSSALALIHVLDNRRRISCTGWPLCHWEVCASSQSDILYLHHPLIDVLMPTSVVKTDQVLFDSDEAYDLEDCNVVVDHYTSCLVTNMRILQAVTLWSFSIVYSETYGVPVLYFHVQDSHGAPCSRPQVLQMLLYLGGTEIVAVDDTWDFISQEQHPITNMPTFFLHPCQSAGRLQLLLRGHDDIARESSSNHHNVLWTWMSMMLPTFGHSIPSALFLQVQDQLK
jgi:2',3'-cyclic-nucleotide 2'-phosphodiesterase (5'-nucleotidase family)